jgi:hypothetical protein
MGVDFASAATPAELEQIAKLPGVTSAKSWLMKGKKYG